MKTTYTLRIFTDDMGSFTQPGCRDLEDALWHVNDARAHDRLPAMSLDELARLRSQGRAKFIQEHTK